MAYLRAGIEDDWPNEYASPYSHQAAKCTSSSAHTQRQLAGLGQQLGVQLSNTYDAHRQTQCTTRAGIRAHDIDEHAKWHQLAQDQQHQQQTQTLQCTSRRWCLSARFTASAELLYMLMCLLQVQVQNSRFTPCKARSAPAAAAAESSSMPCSTQKCRMVLRMHHDLAEC